MRKRSSFANLLLCLAISLLIVAVVGLPPLSDQVLAEGSDPNSADRDSCVTDTAAVEDPHKVGEEIGILELIKLVIL
jgi:hypothetical protein